MSDRKRRFMFIGLAAAVGFLLLSSGNSQAYPIYSNSPGLDNGNEYAVFVLSHVSNTYRLEFDIHVLSTYTGDQWTDFVNGVEIKDFVSSYSNASLFSAPDDVNKWNLSNNELTANGATGGSNSNRLTAAAISPYEGAAVSGADIVLKWVFQFDSTNPLNDNVHIKYLYLDSGGNKAQNTSLGSWDTDIQPPIPEPATMLLLGSGLIGLAGYGRKKFLKR